MSLISSTTSQQKENYTGLFLLILSGELIFILPYVISRIFRPTYLEVFEISNSQLGTLYSIYGTAAIFCYVFGGRIADRYNPQQLLPISMFMTAIGGFYLATYPSYLALKFLYSYWGITTNLLFWSSMIKSTRAWGGTKRQGRAFGFLDGGRGLVASLIGSSGIFIFSFFLTANIESASLEERQEAFRYVILFSSFCIAVVGLINYFFLDIQTNYKKQESRTFSQYFKPVTTVLKQESVWLIMLIVLCAYFGYRVTDIYSLYASEVMQYNEIDAANISALQLYLRPVSCILFGLLYDRSKKPLLWVVLGFVILLIGSLLFASGSIHPPFKTYFFGSLIVIAIGTYAVRALYFALLKEGRIALVLTGTSVGVISFGGYTPDIFSGPLIGYYLDHYPGLLGHQYVFMYLAGFSVIGLICTLRFVKIRTSNSNYS